MQRSYWGYRIDTENRYFFYQELKKMRLRQGWGYHEGQNLHHFTFDAGAGRNLRIFEQVKKGDLLLIPRLPTWDEIMLVEATEDFDTGYQYAIDTQYGDYGHIFPARRVKSFRRDHPLVGDRLRTLLGLPPRFWSVSECQENIEQLLACKD